MVFDEICRICLSVNVRMVLLQKTGLQNFYKTLTNSFMDEDDGPIVCFICHARLIRCRRLQQQAIESNAVLEQLLAGASMSIPKPNEARDEIQFTPICHTDIRPAECDIENDCKDEIFSLESIKVEEENFENENFKFEENVKGETETAVKAEDLEIDALGDRHTDSENELLPIAFVSKKQYITPTNNSEQSEKTIKANFTDSNINDVHKGILDLESPTIKSNHKVKKDSQPINEKGKQPERIMKKKILKQKSVNTLSKKTSGASTKCIIECNVSSKKFSTKNILANHISLSHKTQKISDTIAFRTQVEKTPVLTEIFSCDICEYTTSQKRCVLAHLKAHLAKQVYCCNNCDYICTSKSNLLRHMRIHTGEKPFTCNICGYKCILKSNLESHMRIHTGEKPFSCNICEFKCITKSNLQTHMKIHTGEKPFLCYICEFRCNTKRSLQRHMKIHTGEKPYS